MHKLFRSYGYFFAAGLISSVIAFPAAAIAYVRDRIDRALDLAFSLLAETSPAPRFDGGTLFFGGQRLAYDGPTIDLRHEANTSRRSAARNT